MHTSRGWTLNLNWSDKKSNNKELTWLVCNKFSASNFCTVVHHFFFSACHVLKTWFELSGVKLHRNNLKGNKNYFEVSGRFELLGVHCIATKSAFYFKLAFLKKLFTNEKTII